MRHEFMNSRQAAAYVRGKGLPCAHTTLAKFRHLGGGPKYRKFGRRCTYTEPDMDDWIEARVSKLKSSTSEAPEGVNG